MTRWQDVYKRQSYYLLLLPGHKALKTKELSKQIPTSRLSFASGEDMEEYLNVTPGSATIMGLIFDPENRVQLVIDEELLKEEWFGSVSYTHLDVYKRQVSKNDLMS